MAAVLYAALSGAGHAASDLYTVDPATAAMTPIGPIGFAVSGLAVDPTTGTLYGSTSNHSTSPHRLITIDTSTGAGTVVGDFGLGSFHSAHDIAFDSSGQLWGCDSTGGILWKIDKATGAVTVIGGGDSFAGGLDFDSGGILWKVGCQGDHIDTLDLATGAPTLAATTSDSRPYHSGKFDADGLFWASGPGEAGSAGANLVTVDVNTGAVTVIGAFSTPDVGGLAWVGTGPPPLHANFTGTPRSGPAPLAVSFTDTSTPGPSGPITAWAWDFGDGGTSTLQNPSHTYLANGTYDVSLMVTGTSPDGTSTRTKIGYVVVRDIGGLLFAALAGTHGTSDLYTVDPATAVMTPVGPIGYAVSGLAFDPTTQILYGVTSSNSTSPHRLITIDAFSGAGSIVAALSAGRAAHDIAFDPTGQLWGSDTTGGTLWKIDKATGAVTVVGGGDSYAGGLDFDPGGTLWKVACNHGPGNIDQIDQTTGAPTLVSVASDGNPYHSGKFDAGGLFWASGPGESGHAGDNLATIDVNTGAVTVIGPFSTAGVGGLCWSPPSSPNFSLSLSPNPLTVAPGGSGGTTLTALALNGDTESIALSDTGAPAGVTISYGTNPIVAGGTSALTVSVGGGVPNGVYPIVIHGVGSLNTHTTTLSLRVTPGTDISLSPDTGPCKTLVTVDGSGFAASSALSVTFDGIPVTIGGTTTTDGGGSFSGLTFETPSGLPAATYPVVVTDASGLSAEEDFHYLVATLSMSPPTFESALGAHLHVSGTGWAPATPLDVQVALPHAFSFVTGGWTPLSAIGCTVISGSLTTDGAGAFSAVIAIPGHDFPPGVWSLRLIDLTSMSCPSVIAESLTVCGSGTSHDDTDLSASPVLVGHAHGNDWTVTEPLGIDTVVLSIGGHNYTVTHGFGQGLVRCGDNFYAIFRVVPESPGGVLPIPAWYHTLMVYEISADGSTVNYYFVDPEPFYSWTNSGSSFHGSNNNWFTTLGFGGYRQLVFDAAIVTDGTDVWVGIVAAESRDYEFTSGDDGHDGFASQAAQVAARGGLAGMIATLTGAPGTTWHVDFHQTLGALVAASPPDSDAGDDFSGTVVRPNLALYHFNGSGFDRLDSVQGDYCRVLGAGSGPLQDSSYVSGVELCASPAEPGVCHAMWSEGGAWGRRFGGPGPNDGYDVWDSNAGGGGFFQSYRLGCANLDFRMNYSRWSTAAKTLDNDIGSSHTDRSARFNLATDGSKGDPAYVPTADFPCSNQVILKNDHGAPIAFVSALQFVLKAAGPDADADFLAYFPDYYAKQVEMWDLAGGSPVLLQTLDDPLLPQPDETNARSFPVPSSGIDRLNANPFLGVGEGAGNPDPDLVRCANEGTGGIGASPLYSDPLLGEDVYLLVGGWIDHTDLGPTIDTLSTGVFRVPCAGGAGFDVLDGKRYLAVNPNPTAYAFDFVLGVSDFFSEPRDVWIPMPQSFNVGQLLQLDRECDEGWLSQQYARGANGFLQTGMTMTGGSAAVPPWANWQTNDGFWYDGADTFYLPGRWPEFLDPNTRLFGGVGICVIRRGSVPCPVCSGLHIWQRI